VSRRAGLGNINIVQLALAAVVPAATVWDYEAEVGATRPAVVDAMQDALERAGIEFIEDGVEAEEGLQMIDERHYPVPLTPRERLALEALRDGNAADAAAIR
jgi:hypothetical protein